MANHSLKTRRTFDDAQEQSILLTRIVDSLVGELRKTRDDLEKNWMRVDSTLIQTTAMEALATRLGKDPSPEIIDAVKQQTAEALDGIHAALVAVDTITENVRANGMWVALPAFATEPDTDRYPVEAAPEVMADLMEKYEVLGGHQFVIYAMSRGVLPPASGAAWSIVMAGYGDDDMALYWDSGHEGHKGRIG